MAIYDSYYDRRIEHWEKQEWVKASYIEVKSSTSSLFEDFFEDSLVTI